MTNNQLSNQFLEQSSNLIWMVDSNFRLVYANTAYLAFVKEYTGEEITLQETVFAKHFDEQFIQKWKTYYKRAFNGETFEIEERFFHYLTNEILSITISCKPLFDENKSIMAVACQSKEGNQSTTQKIESNKLLDSSLDVYCVVNEQDHFTYVSAASYNHWGYLPEELIGKSIHSLVLDDDTSKTTQTISKIISGNQIKTFFNRYRKKDGGIAYNLWSAKWDEETKLRYAVAKDAKEIIQEKQHLKLLESVITNSHDAVLITEAEPFDEPGPKIIYVNEAFTKMTGYTSEEVIGKTPRVLQGPNSNKEELRKLSEAIRKWESYENTTINYKKNGEEFWVNFKVTPVADEKGRYTHWVAIERDVTESKLIEENLIKAKEIAEENERKMNEAQKLAHLGSWYYDVINKKSEWSDETYNIWGLDPNNTAIDLVDHQKLVHPKDWERFNDVINNATAKGIPYKMELELVKPDGTFKTVNTIGEPIFNENNKVIAFRGTTQDITERVIIENELRSAKEKAEKSQYSMNQASNLAKIGYWDLDFTTNKLTWSDYIYELYGLSHDDDILKYTEARNFFDSQSQEKIIKASKELIQNGTPYDLELRMINSSNEEIFIRNVVQPVYNEAKEIIGKRGVIQNITDRKKAEAENLFKANLLSNINQAAIATSLNGVVSYWNKAAENIYGWTKEEAIGQNILDLTPTSANLDQAKEIMIALRMGKNWRGEFNVKRKNGTQFPILVSNSPIYDEHNVLAGVIGISSDITIENKNKELLKRYTLELERSNEELEQFAYVASHDLQEPLRMISSFMDLLQRKYGDKIDEKGHQYINFATDGAKRMKNLILDLLQYSRAGKSNETKEKVDLNNILFEFKESRRKVIEEKKATLVYDDMPILQSYRVPITQIFHCLLDNALNYSKENTPPKIEIKFEENKTEYLLSFKDNGIGINPNFHDKIFLIFQRLHNSDKFAGTGIGLSLVKRQVEYLGGKVWLESQEGEGTTFFIQIPKNVK